MIFQIFFIVLCTTSVFADYYETLGVSRSSTDFEIKNSYKKLARKWHPDKNRSPEANEHFTRINEAYEALSNPDKRREYDAFGSVSNDPQDHGHQHTFWSDGGFRNSFFDFGENEKEESNFERTNYRQFKIDILPNSFKQPTLILLVSHFCFSCHHAIRLWGSIASQITESGIRITLADVMTDGRLREDLQIQHVPSVAMIIDGQVKFLQSEITKETVTDFIRHAFPPSLVQWIQSEDELNEFHNSWSRDSRAKMIMAKPLDRPSFRYLSIAFKYRNQITAGFIHLDHNDDDNTARISRAYGLKHTEETVMIFHDEKLLYFTNVLLPKPVGMKSQSRLSLSTIDSLVQSNCLLPLPGLLSQSLFDVYCPPPSQKLRSFGFCVIVVLHSQHKHNLSESVTWQHIRSSISNVRDHGKIMYLFGDVQHQFLRSLQLVDQHEDAGQVLQDRVILLWRQSYTSVSTILLTSLSLDSNIQTVVNDWDILSNMELAVSSLHSQNKVTESEPLSELVDELAAPLWIKICVNILEFIWQIFLFLYGLITEPVYLIIAVLVVVLVSFVYSVIKTLFTNILRESTSKKSAGNQQSSKNCNSGSVCKMVADLTNDSYRSLIQNHKPGRLLCVILTTKSTPADVILMFHDSIARMRCDSHLLAVSVPLDKYPGWMHALLASIRHDDDRSSGVSSVACLSVNRRRRRRRHPYEGIVLALNIGRSHLAICPVNLTIGGTYGDRSIPVTETSTRRRTTPAAVDCDSTDSDEYSATGAGSVEEEEDWDVTTRSSAADLRGRFFDWLGQLMEGTCRKYYVGQWPPSLL